MSNRAGKLIGQVLGALIAIAVSVLVVVGLIYLIAVIVTHTPAVF